MLEAVGKVPPPTTALEFLLAAAAHVPAELRGLVVQAVMAGGTSSRLDDGARTMLSALLFEPRR
jgi:hypothetical protein